MLFYSQDVEILSVIVHNFLATMERFVTLVNDFQYKSSHRRRSLKKVFLEISQNAQENTCARVTFLITFQARPATLLKKRLRHKYFPVHFARFLRRYFLQNTSRRLLQLVVNCCKPLHHRCLWFSWICLWSLLGIYMYRL